MNHKLLLLLAFIAVSSVGASGSKDGCYPKPFETVEFKPPKLPTEGVYFHEEFTNRSVLGTKWVPSDSRLKMHVSHGVSFGHPGRKFTGSYEIASQPKSLISGDYGLLFESSAFWVRLHAIAAKLDKPYHFKLEKPLIVQFEANFVVELSCSFFALKLLPGFEETPALFRWRKYLEDFDDESFFTIAFGPDYPCTEEGKGLTKETRVFVQVGTEHSWPFKHEVHKCVGPVCEEATLLNNTGNHLYTLRMEPDDTFYVYIDNELRTKGNLSEHFEPKIALYDHRFPPQTLSQIGHPKYKGPIPTRFNELRPITAIGLMTNDGARAGIAVDNIIVTDDEKIAREYAEQTYGAKLAQEKALAEPPLICPKKTEKVPVDDSKGAASALNGFRLKITYILDYVFRMFGLI
ncbi:hypothetical protein QR680_010744 [Steinernema hermaphroditum]|uniref:Uncharacterized protein n=1 Tax=Steinernema hermaphroditum TaxID=289476 RepID=A0AA39IRE4_9BILA|nr:hypothetical protein QR680_010744 [Steinernema hermaphroditum]